MELVQHVYSVLAISTREKFYTSLRGLLPEDRYSPLCWESDVTSARRLLLERTFDIVVISTPLPDEFGTRLAQDICQHSAAGVAKKSVNSLLAQDLYKDLRTIQLHGALLLFLS